MKKNKLCLQMSHRAVLNIKGVKKGIVMLHHCKAENVVVRAKFPYLCKLGVYLEYHKPVHSPAVRQDGATRNPCRKRKPARTVRAREEFLLIEETGRARLELEAE